MKTSNQFHARKRVLFICKKRHEYGTSYTQMSSGLLNSATFVVNMLKDSGIIADIVDVIDNNEIDREVTRFKPTHVIIEALWVIPQKFDILHKLHPTVKWIVRLHSEVPFLSNEGIAVEWLKEYHKMASRNNVLIGVNSTRALTDLQGIVPGARIVHMPNYYPVDWDIKTPDFNNDVIDVGGFGAIRPLKNQFTQALAAIIYANSVGKKLRYHIKGSRIVGRGDAILRNIQNLFKQSTHELIEHPWYDHADFIKVVRQMDMGLQISFSETYNIVTADFVNNNVPIIVSDEIKWVSRFYQADPNEIDDIINKMKFAWAARRFGLQKLNKYLLSANSCESQKVWVQLFK